MDRRCGNVKEPEERRYHAVTDDFVETRNQAFQVPPDYPWMPGRGWSALIYTVALIFGAAYLRLHLHVHYRNRRVLRQTGRDGAFLYCNHTQPLGDVFLPALAALPRRIRTVVSPANLAIPVIGRLLPWLGALPLPDTVGGMKQFLSAMEQRLASGNWIAVFPEAHVWEYCSFIRPYGAAAFRYPVKFGKPAYAMTVTYQKRHFSRRPRAIVFLDGPFFPDAALPLRAQADNLRAQVYACMCRRSRESNCDYIRYFPAES